MGNKILIFDLLKIPQTVDKGVERTTQRQATEGRQQVFRTGGLLAVWYFNLTADDWVNSAQAKTNSTYATALIVL